MLADAAGKELVGIGKNKIVVSGGGGLRLYSLINLFRPCAVGE